AHPIQAGDLLLVCNGVIENHARLRQELVEKGYKFATSTDTESLAALLEYYALENGGDLFAALSAAAKRLEGSYACVLMHKSSKKLYAMTQGCPLVLGIGDNEIFLASDPLALARLTNKFIFFEDGDLIATDSQTCEIRDASGRKLKRSIQQRDIPYSQLERGDYRHFTEKEIAEQPAVVRDSLSGRLGKTRILTDSLGLPTNRFDGIKRVHLSACGSAYYAAQIGAYWLQDLVGIPAHAWLGSEYRYRPVPVSEDSLFVCVSQSGETADTLAALRLAQQKPYRDSLVVCNVADSIMARTAPHVLLTRAGREVSVLSTKALMVQYVNLLLLALGIAQEQEKQLERVAAICKDLHDLPTLLEQTLELNPHIEKLAPQLSGKNNAIFLGRGLQYYLAAEGALKMKESSYIHAEVYAAGELKHGPLAIVEDQLPIVALIPRRNPLLLSKMLANLEEVAVRGGHLIIVSSEENRADIAPLLTDSAQAVYTPNAGAELGVMIDLIALQLLAYHVAILRGTDVDQPRNLAKSVTVE
ncbi:MAG: glutamine--fructose-6-phosphate transaminase (isomerizing), partial [Gammaproteobacteria bacterium]